MPSKILYLPKMTVLNICSYICSLTLVKLDALGIGM